MKRKRKRWFPAAVLLLLIVCAGTAFAKEPIAREPIAREPIEKESIEKESIAKEPTANENKTGSITIRLTDGKPGSSKEKILFYCEKIGDVTEGEYVLDEKYRDEGINLNQIETAETLRETAEKLIRYKNKKADKKDLEDNLTSENNASKEICKATDKDGYVEFPNLGVGVYLVRAEDTARYDVIEPTLAAIPMWDVTEEEMLYDVVMLPKHTPRQEKPKPKTGVNEEIEEYLILAAGGLLCMAGAVYRGKRKKQH